MIPARLAVAGCLLAACSRAPTTTGAPGPSSAPAATGTIPSAESTPAAPSAVSPPEASTPAAPPKAWPTTVYQRFALHADKDGFEGALLLVTDARIVQAKLAEKDAGPPPETPVSPLDDDVSKASVELVDDKGAVVDRIGLELGFARMDPNALYGDERRVWAVAVDHSMGMGSYSGPITSFVEIRDKKLRFLEAFDPEARASKRIAVMSSLKTEWRVKPGREGKAKDILEAACRPGGENDAGEMAFVVTLTRYAFESGRWVVHRKQRPGFLEFARESDFPPRADFP